MSVSSYQIAGTPDRHQGPLALIQRNSFRTFHAPETFLPAKNSFKIDDRLCERLVMTHRCENVDESSGASDVGRAAGGRTACPSGSDACAVARWSPNAMHPDASAMHEQSSYMKTELAVERTTFCSEREESRRVPGVLAMQALMYRPCDCSKTANERRQRPCEPLKGEIRRTYGYTKTFSMTMLLAELKVFTNTVASGDGWRAAPWESSCCEVI